jgi:zinc protease
MTHTKIKISTVFLVIFAFSYAVVAQKRTARTNMTPNISTVFQPSESPVVSFRIQFLTGSVDDPKGKEGLASLTAAMIANGGNKKLTYDEINQRFYPMATSFGWQADKEMTTFSGPTHVDNLGKYYGLISQMLLDPGFRADDFKRLKDDAINFLEVNLRQSNDEELGKERLYNVIYKGHPYEHHSMGTVSGLKNITIEDVKSFYRKNYTRANLVLGLSGGFDTKFSKEIYADFLKLPVGKKMVRKIPEPKPEKGMAIDIVQRETRATAMSFGFPINVNRSSKDYAALALVASYFGQHRSSNSYLYGRIREKRGLNYGDYAYIEYFPRGMFQFEPDANIARQQQIFQMWIRPVEPENANFTLRAALYEYDKLVSNGMDLESFNATKQFLTKYVNILTQTKDAELGYALDSKYYGIDNFNKYMKENLARLTLNDVNCAINQHLKTENMRIVLITKDAAGLRDAIVKNQPGKVTYAAEKPTDILDEDKIISVYPIKVNTANITVTPVDQVFK